jgi:hypothetical protein
MIEGLKTKDNEKDKTFRDIYDVLKTIGKIHSRIKKEITSDFIFAKLNPQDKEFVIEMTVNAFDVFSTYVKLEYNIRSKYGNKYFEDMKEQFIMYRDSSFDTFMNRVFMVVNMNRNINDNFMINVLSQIQKVKEETSNNIESIDDLKKRISDMSKENK